MLSRIWNALFPRSDSKIVVRPGRIIVLEPSSRLAVDAEVTGDAPELTCLRNLSSIELCEICDAYWSYLAEPVTGTLEERAASTFSDEAHQRYKRYVNAINELSTRGPEIRDWAISHLSHPDYDARELAAYLVGQLATRHHLGDEFDSAISELCKLAIRPVIVDGKESQANTSAIFALGKIGHPNAIPTLRHLLNSPERQNDDLQWDAARVLGQISGQDFEKADDPVAAARHWLNANPDK